MTFPCFSFLSGDFGYPLLAYSLQWPHHVSLAYLRRLLFSSAQEDHQVLVRGLKLIKIIVLYMSLDVFIVKCGNVIKGIHILIWAVPLE